MQSIFQLCQPRDEVLKGELREDIFAARLRDVMDESADPVYGDAAVFFDNTYPTTGLKHLLKDALGRLVGDAAGTNAILRLETAFGGGKTHNLIALYHIASGGAPVKTVAQLLDAKVKLPKPGEIMVAGVVGSDLDPTLGLDHAKDKVKTYTLWGELAYRLGGRAGYALARQADEEKTAPGTGLFESLIGDRPALIMLDEIARHLRVAIAVPTANKKSNLADQSVAFIMSLLEFAASKERCLVVLTLAGETDAFAQETEGLRRSLAEAGQVSARQERVLTPTDESEIPAIVTHRLFKAIDRKQAKTIVEAYGQYYARMLERDADLPQRSARAEYAQEMAAAYPFHPELLTTLSRKTSTIPNFNQTRGALRLLAWTVRALWAEKDRQPDVWMIHPHHVDLAQPQIAEDLTSRLDRPKFKQVIEADIASVLAGSNAHALGVDQPLVAAGKPPYARRLATVVFLHSLTQGIASGVDPADLMLAVLEPGTDGGDDPPVVKRSLERLYDSAWFLEYDGHRYRFKTEPSINKIIADEMAHVGTSRAKAEVEARVRQIWKKGFLQPIYFPAEPLEVDDDAGLPKLCLMHFDAARVSATEAAPPEIVRRIFEYKGALEAFRTFQNNALFLVADADQVGNMVSVARRYLAIGRIMGDAERMQEFSEEQRKSLKKLQEAAELDVRVAITKTYRHLFYPTSDAPKSHAYLKHETLPAQDQGEVEKDQTNVVIRLLRVLKKAQAADDDVLPAAYVRSKAWEQNQVAISTEDLRKAFARKIGMRMLLDVGQLRKTIHNGVQVGTWHYYDSQEQFAYDKDSPPATWQIGDEYTLYAPDESARLKLRIKGKWKPEPSSNDKPVERCPVCGYPEDQCICGETTPGKRTIPAKFSGQGAAAQAFQQISDGCQEFGVRRVRQVFITLNSSGKQGASDGRALGLAIPQFGKATFSVTQDILATFGPDGERETFHQEFTGSWERYKRLKAVTDAFGQEAAELRLSMRVGAEFADGLEVGGQDWQTMLDVLAHLQVGKMTLEAVPLLDANGTPT